MRTWPIGLSRRHDTDTRMFIAESDGRALGTLMYSCSGESAITIDHVVVIPEVRGGRIARVLVEGAIDWADTQHLEVIPVCRYARAICRRLYTCADRRSA
jgi:predicted GNAT family acetyltransferase